MIESLAIQDFVLVERLVIELDKGLTIFTGETGAGKSILLDALSLALGARGDASLVRSGKSQAVVTLSILVPPQSLAQDILSQQEIILDDQRIILKRILSSDGRSKYYLNDQPVTQGLIRDIGNSLVDIQGQSDRFLDGSAPRTILDKYGKHSDALRKVRESFEVWNSVKSDYQALIDHLQHNKDHQDVLKLRVAELTALNPQVGEEETLHQQKVLAANSHKIMEALDLVSRNLKGDTGIDQRLFQSHKALTRLGNVGQDFIDPLTHALDRAAIEVQEAQGLLEDALHRLEADPDLLDRLEERLYALKTAGLKYGCTSDDLVALLAQSQDDLEKFAHPEEQLKTLERKIKEASLQYLENVNSLHGERLKAAELLQKALMDELPPLKLQHVRIRIDVIQKEISSALDPWDLELSPHGLDEISFLVQTHGLSPFQPLMKVASGGEQARLVLAFKVALAETYQIPTLIFDEADVGLGGAVATAMGERLAALGRDIQVLAITHSPQVAAWGDRHFVVHKNLESATTEVSQLSDAERVEEIARMLAGASVTEEARKAAEQLLVRL